MFHGNRHVTRVAADHDVVDLFTPGQPVEGRVGLDETSMLLGGVGGIHLIDGTVQHVEPRRQQLERRRERRAVEDQQGAQHLGPGRSRLGWRTDDDVARSELETLPAGAVCDHTGIPHIFIFARSPTHATMNSRAGPFSSLPHDPVTSWVPAFVSGPLPLPGVPPSRHAQREATPTVPL